MSTFCSTSAVDQRLTIVAVSGVCSRWMARAGESAKAEATFKRGYVKMSPFAVWTQTPSGGTVNVSLKLSSLLAQACYLSR